MLVCVRVIESVYEPPLSNLNLAKRPRDRPGVQFVNSKVPQVEYWTEVLIKKHLATMKRIVWINILEHCTVICLNSYRVNKYKKVMHMFHAHAWIVAIRLLPFFITLQHLNVSVL